MKRITQFMFVIILGLAFACTPDGDSTIILPENVDSELPEIFQNTWYAGMACQGESYDAFYITLKSNVNNNSFVASGTGYDYDGETLLSFTISGSYDPTTGILKADMNMAVENGTVSRRDRFSVDMNTYTELDYINMENYYMPEDYSGCPGKIRISTTKFWE